MPIYIGSREVLVPIYIGSCEVSARYDRPNSLGSVMLQFLGIFTCFYFYVFTFFITKRHFCVTANARIQDLCDFVFTCIMVAAFKIFNEQRRLMSDIAPTVNFVDKNPQTGLVGMFQFLN